MHIPRILPDEFWPGYVGRLARLNGIESTSQLKTHIKRDLLRLQSSKSLIDWLLETCHLNRTEVVQQHTLIPIMRAIRRKECDVPHGGSEEHFTINRYGSYFAAQHAYVCQQCLKEDHDFWGYSYWRRSHQIEGITWCQKHESFLIQSAPCGDFFLFPEESHPASDCPKGTGAEVASPIMRYADILMGLLDMRYPIPTLQVALRIQARARFIGLRTSQNGRQSNISDHVLTTFPHEWLKAYFPMVADKTSAQFIWPIDGTSIPKSGYRTVMYALTLAALYETSDDALAAITSPLNAEEMTYVAHRSTPSTAAGIGHVRQSLLRAKKYIRKECPTLRKGYDRSLAADFRPT